MSYILEALRRSQAERERGQVPGLGTPALPVAAPEAAQRPWPAWSVAAGLVLVLLALLLVGLLIQRPADTPKPPDASEASARTAAARLATAAPAIAPAAAPALPAAMPASAPPPALVVVSAPVSPPPVASAPPAPRAAPERSAAIPLAQLSPEQRRDWPAFSLGGTVWSESPASRFVIANGQVVREGEAVLPGLVLESIAPRTLRLRWRGLLVDMPH